MTQNFRLKIVLINKLHLLLCFWFVANSAIAQFWDQIADFPGLARDDGSTFSIGDNHYCGLGRDLGFNCTRDFYVFNGSSSSWTVSEALPAGAERQYATGAAWNNKGIIFGGAKCDGSFLNDLWFYDPLTALWTLKTSLPSSGRAGAVHFILEDTLYIIGGKNTTGILSDVWAYDLTNDSWSQKTSFPGDGIWRGIAFQWNGIGYAGFGKNNLNAQTEFNTAVYSFDPQNQQWSLSPSIGLTPRCYIGSTQNDSHVLFFGGLDQSNAILSSFDRLDISNWTMQSLTPFSSQPRKGSMCFLVNDIFYVTTGVSQTERFDETWRIYGVLEKTELFSNSIKLYPNPGSEECRLEFSQIPNKPLTIYSIDGILQQHFENIADDHLILDLKLFSSGIYIIQCGELTQRLEVSK